MARPKKSAIQTVEVPFEGKVEDAIAEAAPEPNNPALIQPIIRVEGDLHPWEELEAEGQLPVLKAIGTAPAFPGARDWVTYIAHICNGKVVKIEVSEPNAKVIALDDLKMAYVTNFIDDTGFLP